LLPWRRYQGSRWSLFRWTDLLRFRRKEFDRVRPVNINGSLDLKKLLYLGASNWRLIFKFLFHTFIPHCTSFSFIALTSFLGRTLMVSQSLFRCTLITQLLLGYNLWSYNSPVSKLRNSTRRKFIKNVKYVTLNNLTGTNLCALVDCLVGQSSGSGDDSDAAALVDVSGHDSDLALKIIKSFNEN
jgi:hypothetical protein